MSGEQQLSSVATLRLAFVAVASVSTCFELSGAMPLSISFGIRRSARAKGLPQWNRLKVLLMREAVSRLAPFTKVTPFTLSAPWKIILCHYVLDKKPK